MSLEIIQEELCKYCESNEIGRQETCEGSYFDNAREAYIDEYGLEENPKDSFGRLKVGDALYRVAGASISSPAIRTMTFQGDKVRIEFESGEAAHCTVPVHLSEFSDEYQFTSIAKKTAVALFEKNMFEKIKVMAKMLAEFSD